MKPSASALSMSAAASGTVPSTSAGQSFKKATVAGYVPDNFFVDHQYLIIFHLTFFFSFFGSFPIPHDQVFRYMFWWLDVVV